MRYPTELEKNLEFCLATARGEGLTVNAVLAQTGNSSFCFLCLILAVPFLQPISLGPFTLISGVAFIFLGRQMAQGHATPTLPDQIGNYRLQGRAWVVALQACQSLLRFFRRFTRPRLESWLTSRNIGGLIFVGGALLAIPFANLPFNNTLPALMILCAALAWIERDGLLVIFSIFWGVMTLVYFVVVGWLLYAAGTGLWQRLMD